MNEEHIPYFITFYFPLLYVLSNLCEFLTLSIQLLHLMVIVCIFDSLLHSKIYLLSIYYALYIYSLIILDEYVFCTRYYSRNLGYGGKYNTERCLGVYILIWKETNKFTNASRTLKVEIQTETKMDGGSGRNIFGVLFFH